MLKKVTKSRHKSRQAFTLVELIVVLVILAVVAAVTIPALTGYIKRTKREKYVDNAHYALVAAQSVMTELYGVGDGYVPHYTKDDKNNVNWSDKSDGTGGTNPDPISKEWGDKVLALMDRGRGKANGEPYIFVFGVGHNDTDCGMSLNQQYTVYYIAYVEDENSPAIFYVNGEWMYGYPRQDDSKNKKTIIGTGTFGTKTFRNTIFLNGGNIPLQFYVVSNRTGLSMEAFWRSNDSRSLYKHSDGYEEDNRKNG